MTLSTAQLLAPKTLAAPRISSDARDSPKSLLRRSPDDTTLDLIGLDRLEESTEIALAEALVALALDEFEEDRPDRVRATRTAP